MKAISYRYLKKWKEPGFQVQVLDLPEELGNNPYTVLLIISILMMMAHRED
jgi:hypothetical protein